MPPQYWAALTWVFVRAAPGGFRCVVVSLRVVTADTVRLAVDGHVCELLLVLKDFARLLMVCAPTLANSDPWREKRWTRSREA
eukprot:3699063-Rhodomonas_salina.1